MRLRGGFVDRSPPHIPGTDTESTKAQIPPDAQELCSGDHASELSKVILPRGDEFCPKEFREEAQRKKQETEDYNLRHHFPHHRPWHELEDSMALDTDHDLEKTAAKMALLGASGAVLDHEKLAEKGPACIVAEWESDRERQKMADAENGKGITFTIVKVEDESKKDLGRRDGTRWHTFAANTDIQGLLPAPESSSPSYKLQSIDTESSTSLYELPGIDCLPYLHPQSYQQQQHLLASAPPSPTASNTNSTTRCLSPFHSALLKDFFSNPLLWLSIFGIIYFSTRIYQAYAARKRAPRGRREWCRERGAEKGDSKKLLMDEEKEGADAWEAAQASGMILSHSDGAYQEE